MIDTMAAITGSPKTKPSSAVRSRRGERRRRYDWSAHLILAGLCAALVAPFFLALIVVDLMLNERVRIVHWLALPFEWIAAACLLAGVAAFGIWLNVVTTRIIIQELVDIARSRRTTGTVSRYVGSREVGTDGELPVRDWDVGFTDSSGQPRTATYSATPRTNSPIVPGSPIRVRYRPDRPDDRQRIRLRRPGLAPLIGEMLLKTAFLAIWMVKISPLPAVVYGLVVYGFQ